MLFPPLLILHCWCKSDSGENCGFSAQTKQWHPTILLAVGIVFTAKHLHKERGGKGGEGRGKKQRSKERKTKKKGREGGKQEGEMKEKGRKVGKERGRTKRKKEKGKKGKSCFT